MPFDSPFQPSIGLSLLKAALAPLAIPVQILYLTLRFAERIGTSTYAEMAPTAIEEVVISTIMLENGAMVQLAAEAAGETAPEFPRADIEKLKYDISRPEQFAINFDYLVRRAKRRER